MSRYRYLCYKQDSKVVLDSAVGEDWKEITNDLINESKEKFLELNNRMEEVQKKFHSLLFLADEVSDKCEKSARKIESGYPDDVMMLQAILDHDLSDDDIQLFCRYIQAFFDIILTSLHRIDHRFKSINTMTKLHKMRAKDRELSHAYDEVARDYDVNNDGKQRSCIFQLYSFLRDFGHGNPAKKQDKKAENSKIDSPEPCANKRSTTEGQAAKEILSESNEDTEDKYLKMPSTSGNLLDKTLIAYAIAKIRIGVQNPDLNRALIKCVRAVQLSRHISVK